MILHYIADPMCSWCWGFTPVLKQIEEMLPTLDPSRRPELRYIMGGLAKDSDQPMPDHVRGYVQGAWKAVAAETGASFNWDFWKRCQPRRSTYPSCRAVLAAAEQDPTAGPVMFHAIQHAYYKEARNPSDLDTLVAIAGEISASINVDRFARDLVSERIDDRLHQDFALRSRLGVSEFPSLVLESNGATTFIVRGYADAETAIGRLRDAVSGQA